MLLGRGLSNGSAAQVQPLCEGRRCRLTWSVARCDGAWQPNPIERVCHEDRATSSDGCGRFSRDLFRGKPRTPWIVCARRETEALL